MALMFQIYKAKIEHIYSKRLFIHYLLCPGRCIEVWNGAIEVKPTQIPRQLKPSRYLNVLCPQVIKVLNCFMCNSTVLNCFMCIFSVVSPGTQHRASTIY